MKYLITHLKEWGEMPKRPGLYLSLSHGRAYPQQTMRGRGFAGPKIGPVHYVRTLYGQELTVQFANKRDAVKFFPDATSAIQTLQVVEGTLVYLNQCFGDWDVCYIPQKLCSNGNEESKPTASRLP